MKTVNFYTLGCKVNMYETEAMKKLFIGAGYTVTGKDDADVFVINTCTVTAMSDRKSRQMIRRAKHKNPNSIVVVAGCFSQVSQKQAEEMPEADIIVGTYGRKDIVKYVENYKGKKMNCVYDEIPAVFEEMPSESQSRTRAVIKIQDGCRNFCSYCIIPYARGPLRSRGIDEIIKEVTMLTKKGYKEFVFVGINLACYNYDGLKLGDVIEKVCEIDGVKRVRLGSLEPNVFTEKFLKTVKNQPKLCKHFHISLQSGCNETLKRMNRHYTSEHYLSYLEKIREVCPDVNFTTDVMVGFAGETEEEFNESIQTVKKAGFGSIHVFPYSVRKGTAAEKMDNHVDNETKTKRAEIMTKTGEQLTRCKLEGFIGQTVEVLFETEKDGIFEGFTDSYIKVRAKGENLFGEIVSVTVTGAEKDFLTGEI